MSNPTVVMIWGWVRVFLVAFGSVVLADIADGGFSGLNWEAAAIAGLLSAGPIIFNYLNPNDPRYGKGYAPPVAE